MPQLDIYSYFPQLLWVFIYFYVLLFCLYGFVYFWNFKTEVLRKDYFFFNTHVKKSNQMSVFLRYVMTVFHKTYQGVYISDFFVKVFGINK